jgi:hypothetical protein
MTLIILEWIEQRNAEGGEWVGNERSTHEEKEQTERNVHQSLRQQHPVIELEHDRWIVLVALLVREIVARVVLRGDRPQA